jgi:desulfoferrodoxin (superoxide reductase-like protein)
VEFVERSDNFDQSHQILSGKLLMANNLTERVDGAIEAHKTAQHHIAWIERSRFTLTFQIHGETRDLRMN